MATEKSIAKGLSDLPDQLSGNTQIQILPDTGTQMVRGRKSDVNRVIDVIKQIGDAEGKSSDQDENADPTSDNNSSDANSTESVDSKTRR